MNITDLLGAMMQSGMSPSSGNRMKNAFGGGGSGGGLLESLAGMLGGQSPQGGGLGSIFSQALGGGSGSGGLGGILGNVLNDAKSVWIQSSNGSIVFIKTGSSREQPYF